jgi:hypothetical protein
MIEGEVVYVSKRSGSGDKVFHTDPDECEKAATAKSMSRRSRETMEAWGWTECSYCNESHPRMDDEKSSQVDIREQSVRYQIEDGKYE